MLRINVNRKMIAHVLFVLAICGVSGRWQVENPFLSPQMNPDNLKFDDIKLTPYQQKSLRRGNDMGGKRGNGFAANNNNNLRWKDAVVPYIIDCSIEKLPKAVDAVMKAMKEWEDKTCIRFVKRTNEKYFVKFFRGAHCYGSIGKTSYAGVSVGYGCEFQHVMTHEIGHVVGFYHEMNRKDRDDYVKIHWENIAESTKRNFDIIKNSDSLGVPYDYESIMHYPWSAFSSNGKDTMTPIKDTSGKIPYVGLSKADALQTSLMYDCPAIERKRKLQRRRRYRIDEIRNKRQNRNNGCVDENKYCADWAKAGLCSTDVYTKEHCHLSCGTPPCKGPSSKKPTCIDKDSACADWAYMGHCEINKLVAITCQKSCNPLCKGSIKPTQRTKETVIPTRSTNDVKRVFLGKGILCADNHPSCKMWAEIGECKRNPSFMLDSCKLSCKVSNCDKPGLKPKGKCANPLGLSWNGSTKSSIPDSAFYSPLSFSPGGSWKAEAKNARLYFEDDYTNKRVGAWCAPDHEKAKTDDSYIQVDLGVLKRITYIATQGRYEYFERVSKFKIQYSNDGKSFKTYQQNSSDKIFDGNCDHVTPVLNKFDIPFQARYIRYRPVEWNFPCVRMEFYGC